MFSCVTPVLLLAAALTASVASAARAAEFNVANTADAGTWSLVTGQSFSATATSALDPAVSSGSTVYLEQFQFFKGAAGPAESNAVLVILSGAYPDLSAPTTNAAYVVGISNNSISSSTTYASGDALTFTFDNLPLTYGNTYSAGLFTISGTTMTPVQVNVLTANYAENPAGSGTYLPVTNYGGVDNYNAAADYSVSGGYYSAFSHGGDTNFYATLTTAVPEPGALTVLLPLVPLALRRR